MNSAEQQLRMVVEKHKEHIKEIDVCIQMCTELGMQLAETSTPAEQMSKLEDQVVSYVKMEHEMQAHIAALNEVILELQRVLFSGFSFRLRCNYCCSWKPNQQTTRSIRTYRTEI